MEDVSFYRWGVVSDYFYSVFLIEEDSRMLSFGRIPVSLAQMEILV
jgi:hypothetical protein